MIIHARAPWAEAVVVNAVELLENTRQSLSASIICKLQCALAGNQITSVACLVQRANQ